MSAHRTARLPADWHAGADTLRDRAVLVTGAAGGLGKATALAAASSGAAVILLGRKVPQLEKVYDAIAALGRAQPAIYPMDLSGATAKDYADLAATIDKEFGRLDGVVHAAAHFDSLRPALNIASEEWLRSLHVNVSAPFLLTQACGELLSRADEASVIFVIDDPERTRRAHWGGYGVAKHALAVLASILHDEWEKTPVRVHTVLPPPMRTTLRRAAYYGENTMQLPTPDEFAPALLYLLGRDGAAARGAVLDLRSE
jgi:NAD(P)-dependent dehydrogenase (short-subunit alcohol dehydrogenase family)